MTALPKRKPARRTTMAKPEPAPQPERHLDWAQLTAPLEHYQVPVIFTPVARQEAMAYLEQLRTDWGTDGIQAFNDASEAKACLATYEPCINRHLAAGATPKRLPSERLLPAMLP